MVPLDALVTTLVPALQQVKRWSENWDQHAWPLFECLEPKPWSRNSLRHSGDRQLYGDGFPGARGWSLATVIEAALVFLMVTSILLVLKSALGLVSWLPDWLQ